ncbi:hypothetical protein GGI01_002804 [Coemansia sp. RSA 376]|nr:hypothetical protein GGI01_002804 [Coemansia sp. RSA 376]
MQLCSLAKGALSALLVLAAVPAALGDSDYIETNVHYLRQFNLEPPFIDEGFQMRNFDYGGDAIINTASHIRLTPDAPSRIGWVWSTMSLPNDYWKIEFDFKIGGKGGYLYGDGMGFFNPYLGFTALTGDISDNHDLLEVRAETLSSEALKNYNSMPNLPKDIVGKVAGTSFFGFVFKALLLSGVCGGLFVAYKKYSADSARRF